jgi:aryl-alcohol dehydrogenase-like predicted oxidoreductase
VQNEYSILHREPEDGVLAYCARTGTAFLPYFPLASGVLSGKYHAGAPVPEGTRMAGWGERAKTELSDERLAKVVALDALAQTEGHTVLDLAFAWLLSRSSVASVIAGATKLAQVASNVAAGQWEPSAELLAQVDVIAPR